MKNIFFFTLLLLIIGSSCKKSTPAPVVTPADKYMTYTSGSSWNYLNVVNPSSKPDTTNSTHTSTNRDTLINSNSYHVYTSSDGTQNDYYRNTGNDYYNYRSLPPAFGGTNVEVLYLKDNLTQGSQWAQTFPVVASGIPFNLTLTNTIAGRNLSVVVNNTTYNNVIWVTTTLSTTGLPFALTITSNINYYFAPKFGLIKSNTYINATATTPLIYDTSQFLMSATLQ